MNRDMAFVWVARSFGAKTIRPDHATASSPWTSDIRRDHGLDGSPWSAWLSSSL